MELPFKEENIGGDVFIREFSQNTNGEDFFWHRDREDRIIESTHETNWLFQLDNQLPIKISGKIYIPRGVFHRLIKGSGDLFLKVNKLK
jgi:hypothetical protein